MRAVVLHVAGEALRMEERPDAEPAPGELIVHVEACARAFHGFALSVTLQVEATSYSLATANVALDELRWGRLQGAAVLVP